jgi:hypothetical protein
MTLSKFYVTVPTPYKMLLFLFGLLQVSSALIIADDNTLNALLTTPIQSDNATIFEELSK